MEQEKGQVCIYCSDAFGHEPAIFSGCSCGATLLRGGGNQASSDVTGSMKDSRTTWLDDLAPSKSSV